MNVGEWRLGGERKRSSFGGRRGGGGYPPGLLVTMQQCRCVDVNSTAQGHHAFRLLMGSNGVTVKEMNAFELVRLFVFHICDQVSF